MTTKQMTYNGRKRREKKRRIRFRLLVPITWVEEQNLLFPFYCILYRLFRTKPTQHQVDKWNKVKDSLLQKDGFFLFNFSLNFQ